MFVQGVALGRFPLVQLHVYLFGGLVFVSAVVEGVPWAMTQVLFEQGVDFVVAGMVPALQFPPKLSAVMAQGAVPDFVREDESAVVRAALAGS